MPLTDDSASHTVKQTRAGYALLCCIGAALVWALTYLPWLGLLDLLLEEPRRALIARTMLETGDYWVPRLGGEIYTAKPPLFNWLIALTATVTGELDEWSARLPAVISVALLAVVMVWGARHWLRPWSLAFLAAALILAPEFLVKGRLAEIETLFALLVAASLWSWFLLYRRGAAGVRLWLLPLVLVALAYLAKREPAPVFFYLAVAPFLLWRGQWRMLLQRGHFIGIGVAALLVGGWLVGVALQTGWETLWNTLQREVLERGLTAQGWGGIVLHIVLYPLELLASMLPFSLLLPLLAAPAVWRGASERFGELFLFCLIGVVVNLPVYWFRGDVSVRYFLPMFPFVLLMAAMVFEVLFHEQEKVGRWGRRYLRAIHWSGLGIGAVLVLALLVSMVLPWVDAKRSALLPTLLTLGIVLAGAGSLWWLWRSENLRPMLRLLVLFCAINLVGRALYFNLILPDKVQRVAAELNAPLIASQLRNTVGPEDVVLASGVPWAVWYYSTSGFLQPLPGESPPAPGSWLLINERLADQVAALGFPAQESIRYVYKGDVLLLGRIPLPVTEEPPQ
ncbi:MAG: hypothetical protein DWQ09_05625 [Proteobacteria bacterium]|nr:MAG: hypothetical protein DWQ09_05625 [Pseudomonadota bacterium]QKK11426.1 MAG: hypothetical protein HND59_07315 [Pseudomonadota bacterium]